MITREKINKVRIELRRLENAFVEYEEEQNVRDTDNYFVSDNLNFPCSSAKRASVHRTSMDVTRALAKLIK